MPAIARATGGPFIRVSAGIRKRPARLAQQGREERHRKGREDGGGRNVQQADVGGCPAPIEARGWLRTERPQGREFQREEGHKKSEAEGDRDADLNLPPRRGSVSRNAAQERFA